MLNMFGQESVLCSFLDFAVVSGSNSVVRSNLMIRNLPTGARLYSSFLDGHRRNSPRFFPALFSGDGRIPARSPQGTVRFFWRASPPPPTPLDKTYTAMRLGCIVVFF